MLNIVIIKHYTAESCLMFCNLVYKFLGPSVPHPDSIWAKDPGKINKLPKRHHKV
jgi:hypothetical protein